MEDLLISSSQISSNSHCSFTSVENLNENHGSYNESLSISNNDSFKSSASLFSSNLFYCWKGCIYATNPRESACVRYQHPLQNFCRPGNWFPCLRKTHVLCENWSISRINAENMSEHLLQLLQNLSIEEEEIHLHAAFLNVQVHKFYDKYKDEDNNKSISNTNGNNNGNITNISSKISSSAFKLVVNMISQCGWLDILELTFTNGIEFNSCNVVLNIQSTGLLPLKILGAPICNIALCFVPFFSWHHSERINFIKEKLASNGIIVKVVYNSHQGIGLFSI